MNSGWKEQASVGMQTAAEWWRRPLFFVGPPRPPEGTTLATVVKSLPDLAPGKQDRKDPRLLLQRAWPTTTETHLELYLDRLVNLSKCTLQGKNALITITDPNALKKTPGWIQNYLRRGFEDTEFQVTLAFPAQSTTAIDVIPQAGINPEASLARMYPFPGYSPYLLIPNAKPNDSAIENFLSELAKTGTAFQRTLDQVGSVLLPGVGGLTVHTEMAGYFPEHMGRRIGQNYGYKRHLLDLYRKRIPNDIKNVADRATRLADATLKLFPETELSTPLVNRVCNHLSTWPLAIAAMHQVALNTIDDAINHPTKYVTPPDMDNHCT